MADLVLANQPVISGGSTPSLDKIDPNAIKYINTRSIDYAKQVNKTTTEKIDKILIFTI